MAAKSKKQRFYTMQLLLIVGIPVLILFAGIALLKIREPELLPKIQKQQTLARSTDLTLNTIAKTPLEYDDKTVTLVGTAVIRNKNCSDPTLVLTDTSKNILKNAKEIKMFDRNKSALCQKKAGTCDAECSDFENGEDYEVTGKIILERPLGMTLSQGYLDYYIEVEKTQKILQEEKLEKNNFAEQLMQKFQLLFSPKEL